MEFVLVVKRYDLFDRAFPHGFVAKSEADGGPGGGPDQGDAVARWTARIRERAFFVERRHAESDSSFKQVIPYTMVMHGEEILLLKRLDAGGEARLHGKLSIGVGGHINPVDTERGGQSAGVDVLDAGCRRELEEEIEIRSPYTLKPVGAINDDASDVGSVHFGLVNIAHCETPDVVIRETDMLEGSFVSRAALAEIVAREPERFETWSALIIARLDALLG